MDNIEQLELLPTSIDSNKVVLKFETTEHAIDATLVANTLLAFDKTIKGFADFENLPGITVDVENIKSGCIEIGAIISIAQALEHSAEYITSLWAYLKELYLLYKFLRGQPPAKVEKENGKNNVTIENHIGEKATYSTITYNQYVFNGPTIFGNGEDILKNPNISELKLLDGEKNIILQVPRAEFSNIVPFKKVPKDKLEQISEAVCDFTIETVPLGKPQAIWKFVGEDGNRFSAKIQDDNFIHRIRSGAIAFKQGDKMKCKLEIRKHFDVSQNTFVTDKIIIKEVIQYTPKVHTITHNLPGVWLDDINYLKFD